MTNAKLREGLLLLLKTNPQLADVLFDFSEPYKIDLRAFMQENYRFNVRTERFAYLSGRGLQVSNGIFKRNLVCRQAGGLHKGGWKRLINYCLKREKQFQIFILI